MPLRQSCRTLPNSAHQGCSILLNTAQYHSIPFDQRDYFEYFVVLRGQQESPWTMINNDEQINPLTRRERESRQENNSAMRHLIVLRKTILDAILMRVVVRSVGFSFFLFYFPNIEDLKKMQREKIFLFFEVSSIFSLRFLFRKNICH